MKRRIWRLPAVTLTMIMIIVITVTVCACLLIKADSYRRQADNLSRAVIISQNAASLWQAAGSLTELNEQLGGTASGSTIRVEGYDELNEGLCLVVQAYNCADSFPYAQITVYYSQSSVYTATVYRQGAIGS